jgi:hypothetical protein
MAQATIVTSRTEACDHRAQVIGPEHFRTPVL